MKKSQKLVRSVSLLALICCMALPSHVAAKEGPSEAGVAALRDDDVRNAETNVDREKIHSDGIIESRAHQRPAFPATITSANCPIIVNESLSIDGQDFGIREGTVIVAFSDRSFTCEIEKWTDTNVRCHLPDEMIMAFGRSPEEAVIWLRPARITPPEPGLECLHCDKNTYYYTGEEGPRYVCTLLPIPAACTGVDLVLNKIEARKWTETACVAKVWISQVCEGETTVDSFFVMFTEGEENYAAGWDIRAGWQGPTSTPYESGWLVRGCGTITGIADYLSVEPEVNEENNECSVTITEGQDSVSRICHDF